MLSKLKGYKNNKVYKIALLIICIFCVCGIIELISNIRLLGLPRSERGKYILEESQVDLEGFEKKGSKYILSEDSGKITWSFNKRYISKFTYDFSSSGFLNAEIQWGRVNGFGNVETQTEEDHNPILLNSSTVNIGDNATWISIEIKRESDENNDVIEIYKPIINNTLRINIYRICSVILISMMIVLLYFFREVILKKLEYGFVIVALFTGIIMLINIPANKVGWDEEVHVNWAYRMSLLPGGEMVSDEIAGQIAGSNTVYNWPLNQPLSCEENQQWNNALNQAYEKESKTTLIKGGTASTATPGLAIQALAIKFARGLGLSYTGILFCGRMASLILYISLVFFAIKIVPIGKRILTFISLTPTSIFTAVCYTYDVLVYGGIVLGMAMILNEWLTKDKLIDTKKMIGVYAIWFVSMFAKAIYVPLALLGFMVPLKKYKSKRQRAILWVIYFLTIFSLLAIFVVPTVFCADSYTDTRFVAADSPAQIRNILSKPFTYALILLQNIFQTLPDYAFGSDCYRLMGHLPTAGFMYLFPIIAVFLILTDHTKEHNIDEFSIRQRVVLFIILGVIVSLIWTALYISFSLPGSSKIEGVQGRYYRPILPLLYMIFGSKYVQVNISCKKYNAIVLGLCSLIMSVTSLGVLIMFRL